MREHEHSLCVWMQGLKLEQDDDLDRQGMVGKIVTAQLLKLAPQALAELVEQHWTDFDLYGEIKDLDPESQVQARSWLDELTLSSRPTARPLLPENLRGVLIDKLVQAALFFERRAHTFKEVHPLALQVSLSSGGLNGLLVVRSIETCALMLEQLLMNTLETELKVEPENYRLVEKSTGSTLRVFSRDKRLLPILIKRIEENQKEHKSSSVSGFSYSPIQTDTPTQGLLLVIRLIPTFIPTKCRDEYGIMP